MNIVRHDPWGLMNRLHQDINSLWANQVSGGEEEAVLSNWVPAVDIEENSHAFTIRADLPGVKADDVDITMDNGVLSIEGSRELQADSDEGGVTRRERISGRFLRRFRLPKTVNPEGIKATAQDGVLEIVLPKQPEVQPRRITVNG